MSLRDGDMQEGGLRGHWDMQWASQLAPPKVHLGKAQHQHALGQKTLHLRPSWVPSYVLLHLAVHLDALGNKLVPSSRLLS